MNTKKVNLFNNINYIKTSLIYDLILIKRGLKIKKTNIIKL